MNRVYVPSVLEEECERREGIIMRLAKGIMACLGFALVAGLSFLATAEYLLWQAQ